MLQSDITELPITRHAPLTNTSQHSVPVSSKCLHADYGI